MIEPTIAVSQVEMSKNSSSGSASKIAPAMKPPSRAPTMPMMAVTMNPPGSSPRKQRLRDRPREQPKNDERDDAHEPSCRLQPKLSRCRNSDATACRPIQIRPLRPLGTSSCGPSDSSGHVLNDQHRRLIGVVIANANNAQRPLPQRDLVPRAPVRERRSRVSAARQALRLPSPT